MKLFNNFFQGKKVLVTGHTGFKGSWLSIWLKELGADVIGYSLKPYTNNDNFVVTKLGDKIKSIIGDVRDYQNLLNVFKTHKPDIAFHLAAQSLVRFSYKEPKMTFDTNIGGTVNFLECVKQTKSVQVAVIITSDKCYENKEWIWGYRENDPLGGHDPYSTSKACCELITSAYQKSFFKLNSSNKNTKSIFTVRAGNVIGGGDWREDRLISDCIKALKQDKKIEIRNPNSVRPWQFVLEPLGGYLLLTSKMANDLKYSGAWNFGPNSSTAISVSKIVNKIIDQWGSGTWVNLSKSTDKHETKFLRLDISKAQLLLNWSPVLDINETIKMTVDWYKEDLPDYEFDVKQIKEYISIGKKKKIDWIS
ncbi:MAG: CDP-glucose 4,6-dehydratase [Candidatus Helarchaeota archaeon]